MQSTNRGLTTGLAGLDRLLKGILPGDNIVWQVDSVEDYMAFATPYCQAARSSGRRLIYFRFAKHDPLLPADFGAEVHELRPERGFESFIANIHSIIEEAGRGSIYLLDCLSDLAVDWYSDEMLGNFFMLTCPYLYDLETVTYFALLRNRHSSHATGAISGTTQLLLDVYRHEGTLYVRPLKCQHRHSPTMDMLHVWKADAFEPVTSSAEVAEVLTSEKWGGGLSSEIGIGSWERAFIQAEELLEAIHRGEAEPEAEARLLEGLLRMIVSRDEGMLRLAARYLTLESIVGVQKRMIGTGLIGGKTLGVLLARAIMSQDTDRPADLFEPHDSFFIGSDVFYSYLVRNGVWWVRQKQRNPDAFLEGADQARQNILTGTFPGYIVKQLERMLDYFGQSPIIVRSSSLLEDNYGNSFAGKYESVFCANQSSREKRLDDLLAAVRTIYASTMSEKALRYRAQRGLLDRDEQMALLVMRVSGAMHGSNFFPDMAGVGFSFNPYAWSEYIDPKAGLVRLVFGLGTRAVERSDDDYTRVVALNAPNRRPEANFEEVREHAQRRVDYLDLEANQLVSSDFSEVVAGHLELPLEMVASRNASEMGRSSDARWVLTFDKVLAETRFVEDMRQILATLERAYSCPVDIEFTANFLEKGAYKINLLQCRTLQVRGTEGGALPRVEINRDARIIAARGAVIGHSRLVDIDLFIYVVPEVYGQLPIQQRYEVARLIGKVNRSAATRQLETIMLLGPGRWGTSTPSLGIPVSFADINNVSVLCEIVAMRQDLVPDVSLGTHFLCELVEMDMLYLALFPEQGENYIDKKFFEGSPNVLLDLVPSAEKWCDGVKVIDTRKASANRSPVKLIADAVEQKVVCYFES
ncbi:MAG: PEP/pyruvate-binding domain-containing protein [Thermoleophilia bacterium]|nr:PEP/pyruvate-binding domain-containing protein [Thermoleophilia bacterium]